MIFKLDTRNVHHIRNKMTPTILLPWQHPWFQSLSVKNQISPFATSLSGTGGLPGNRHGSQILLTLHVRLLRVDDPCVRWNLGILVFITSSNQRLWECVRCHINVYPDTLNDFPSWLSTSKNQPFFINNRGFTERYFRDKVHTSLIDWWLRCVTATVSVDSHVE